MIEHAPFSCKSNQSNVTWFAGQGKASWRFPTGAFPGSLWTRHKLSACSQLDKEPVRWCLRPTHCITWPILILPGQLGGQCPLQKGFYQGKHDNESHMRVVRKVLVLSYEGENVLVLALTSAKVPRRGLRKLIFYLRMFCVRVAC